MVLTAADVTRKGIVQGTRGTPRPTTYDATVGSIIRRGSEIDTHKKAFRLKPREIIWLVSAETFNMGDSTTGLATLKTQWTHQGVLALNVGVVDPGWNGPLATAVVNFSSVEFPIKIGDPFLRLLFHGHTVIAPADLDPHTMSRQDYVRKVSGLSMAFSDTFLDMSGLAKSVTEEVLGKPRWALYLSFAALVIGLVAIMLPIGWDVWKDSSEGKAKVTILEQRVDELQKVLVPGLIDPAKCHRETLSAKVRLICLPD